MPIYEYQCQQCGQRLETMQKLSEAPLRDCPQCGAPALSKLISRAGFRLKGGGWYETDFKAGNKRNILGAPGANDTSGNVAADAGGESKVAADKPIGDKPAAGSAASTD